MLKKTDLFFAVMMRGILGGVIGILSGFVLGLLIWTLMKVTIAIDPVLAKDDFAGEMLPMIEFLSMALGAVLGTLFGSQVAFKEKK